MTIARSGQVASRLSGTGDGGIESAMATAPAISERATGPVIGWLQNSLTCGTLGQEGKRTSNVWGCAVAPVCVIMEPFKFDRLQ
jgi:hypothetical protein